MSGEIRHRPHSRESTDAWILGLNLGLYLYLPISPHCIYDGRGTIPYLKIKKADVLPLSCALPVELPSDLYLRTNSRLGGCG